MEKNSILKPIILINIFFLLVILVYFLNIFSQIKSDQFLMIHDQGIFLSQEHINKMSYMRNPTSGGIGNGFQFAMSLPNLIFYSALFKAGLSIKSIEMILFPLSLYVLLSLSFIGFLKLYQNEEENLDFHDWLNILILTFFYCFNMNIVGYATRGGLWSLGFVFTYSLLPLLVYYINKFIKNNSLSLQDAVILSLILFASSNYIILFAAIVLTLPIYIFVRLLFKKNVLS